MRLRTQRRLTMVWGALLIVPLLAVPALAGKKPKNDGTLSIKDGRGTIEVVARGTVIGRIASGDVLVVDGNRFDSRVPVLRGGRLVERKGAKMGRAGKNIRFRVGGGSYRLRIQGLGVSLSSVGRGSVLLDGDERFADTGLYSLNGGEFLPVPYERTTLQLAAPPPAG